KPMPSTRQPSDHTPARPTIAAPAGPRSGQSHADRDPAFASPAAPLGDPPRDPDFERNPGDIVWYRVDDARGPVDVVAADEDDIAVVRHAFTHVALVSRP
ncbi:MAG TPA: hypothetical protein VHN14_14825, partial [Kofleriaceae bacterium]|nr:hypothetical protein [Kofleriaceae bacterium]